MLLHFASVLDFLECLISASKTEVDLHAMAPNQLFWVAPRPYFCMSRNEILGTLHCVRNMN